MIKFILFQMRAGDDDQRICDRQSKHELRLQSLIYFSMPVNFFFIQGRLKCKCVFKLGRIRTFSLEREF